MSNRKKPYLLSVKELKAIEKDCDYLFLIGARGNGKSYATKSHVLKQAYENINKGKCEKQIGYIRRYDLDCKDSLLEPYFADMPIQEITDGTYTCISVYRKKIYFAHHNNDGKIVRDVCIGQCFSLSGAEHYKSLMFPYIYNIIFEEVIAQDNNYLYKEVTIKFQQLISTILRNRKGKVYLIGNTLSRICPYYGEFGLVNAESIPIDSYKDYKFEHTTIRVYRVKPTDYNSGMFWGNSAKNITDGEYITENQPHLSDAITNYDILYTCVLKYENFKYLMQFLKHKTTQEYVWYVMPKTTDIQKNTRVIALEYNSNIYWTHGFLPFTEKEKTIFNMLIKHKMVCFSDNLTGTEFNNIITNFY